MTHCMARMPWWCLKHFVIYKYKMRAIQFAKYRSAGRADVSRRAQDSLLKRRWTPGIQACAAHSCCCIHVMAYPGYNYSPTSSMERSNYLEVGYVRACKREQHSWRLGEDCIADTYQACNQLLDQARLWARGTISVCLAR